MESKHNSNVALTMAKTGFTTYDDRLPQCKIKKAEPLYLKAKSLSGIDTSFNNIELLYKSALTNVLKQLYNEKMAF